MRARIELLSVLLVLELTPLPLHRNACNELHISVLPPPSDGVCSYPRRLTNRAACLGLSSSLPARMGLKNEHTGLLIAHSSCANILTKRFE